MLGKYLSPESDVVWSGDITMPFAGVAPAERWIWRGRIDYIIHCAGSISFDSAMADETWRANVDGTQNMLRLAEQLRVPAFVHLSTAYIAGNANRFTEDDLDVGQENNNVYEESKLAAEEVVREWKGGNWTIHRMSIMIGNSRTGFTPTFTGYYGFLLSFWRLLGMLRQMWEENEIHCRRQGIEFSEDGTLRLPLNIKCSETAKLNLITSDWLSSIIADTIENHKAENRTLHPVHPNPPLVKWAIETSLKFLGIEGLKYNSEEQPTSPLLARMQRILDRGLERYYPYVNHGPEFTYDKLVASLGGSYYPPPPITESLLSKMLDYAIRMNFGRENQT
jgi:nucleoside-diphosphate-sugar epimerase